MNAITAVLRLLSRRGEPNRRVRRIAVILALLLIPLIGAVSDLRALGVPHNLFPIFFVAALIAICGPLFVLTEFRRNVIRRSDADERERQRRDEAYRISYRIVQVAMPIGLLSAVLVHAFAPKVLEPWFALSMAILWYVIFLPYMVFAWREPDLAG